MNKRNALAILLSVAVLSTTAGCAPELEAETYSQDDSEFAGLTVGAAAGLAILGVVIVGGLAIAVCGPPCTREIANATSNAIGSIQQSHGWVQANRRFWNFVSLIKGSYATGAQLAEAYKAQELQQITEIWSSVAAQATAAAEKVKEKAVDGGTGDDEQGETLSDEEKLAEELEAAETFVEATGRAVEALSGDNKNGRDVWINEDFVERLIENAVRNSANP